MGLKTIQYSWDTVTLGIFLVRKLKKTRRGAFTIESLNSKALFYFLYPKVEIIGWLF